MTESVSQEQLKDLLKTAFTEVLEERRDLLFELVEEALEEFALVRAIEEGRQTALASRSEIFSLLEARE